MPRRLAALTSAALCATGVLSSCGSEGTGSTPAGSGNKLAIEASFYPLQWMAERVGGDHVSVANLTKPGAEPHDLELSPKDVAALQDADLIVYLSGFQPAVDDAVDASSALAFDAASTASLDLTFTPVEEGKANVDEANTIDPHFWLDPSRLATVANTFARTLAKADPPNALDYERNAKALAADLDALDAEFTAGLDPCKNKDLVTSHNAFGYLAKRYGLNQVAITGLTPETEPSAGQLADVAAFVEDNDVRTIYFETLVSPDVARTVARESGAKTAVLDPIEGLSDASQGDDYLAIMRANLANLKDGQPCP